jgi:hypothetical protein
MTPAQQAVSSVLTRLEALLEAEIGALSAHHPYDHDAASRQKSRALLELVRAQVTDVDIAADPALAARLRQVRETLVRDRELLAIHLEASREVSEILSSAMRDADWDGTYDSRIADPVVKG